MSAESQFLDLLLAAMQDATIEGKCTQLQTTITPPGHRAKLVRLIVVPEEMDYVRTDPAGKFQRTT